MPPQVTLPAWSRLAPSPLLAVFLKREAGFGTMGLIPVTLY
jgi:hypothetical protein